MDSTAARPVWRLVAVAIVAASLVLALAARARALGSLVIDNLARTRAVRAYLSGRPADETSGPVAAAWVAGLSAFDHGDRAGAVARWRQDPARSLDRLIALTSREWTFGSHERSLDLARCAVDLAPDASAPITTLVEFDMAGGRPAAALDDLQRALARSPRNAAAIALQAWRLTDSVGVSPDRVAETRIALSIAPDDPTVLRYAAEVLRLSKGDDSEIERLLLRGNRAVPETDVFAYELLKMYTAQRRFADGEPMLRRLLVTRASDPSALEWQGFFRAAAGRYGDALAFFQTAATLAPSDPRFQLDIGDAERQMGDRAGAERAWEIASRLGDPNAADRLRSLDLGSAARR